MAVVHAGLLNPAQRSSLTIGLRAFEMHLRQADAWLLNHEERGILYRRSLGLSPEQRAVAHAQIAAALARITALAERFDLTASEDDLGGIIASEISVDWANLCDARSGKLRCCGRVDARLAELLDGDVDALAQLALSPAAVKRDDQAP